MSGYPHGLDVTNQTGGGMTAYHKVRDALCNMRDQPSGTMGINGKRLLTDAAAYGIAPHIARALNELIDAMSAPHFCAMPQEVRARWHDVFVAAMTEES